MAGAAPVCFDREDFASADFDAGAFVRKWQASVTLDGLREDLRHYTKELKDRLYELINRDYADFVKINSKLAGVDEVVEVVALPLRSVRAEVSALHGAVEGMRLDMERAVGAVARSRACGELLATCVAAVEAAALCQTLLNMTDDDGVGIGVSAASPGPNTSPEACAMQHGADRRWEAGRGLTENAGAFHLVRLKGRAEVEEAPEEADTMRFFVRPGGAFNGQWEVASRKRHRYMRRCFALERTAHLCVALEARMVAIEDLARVVQQSRQAAETKVEPAPQAQDPAADAEAAAAGQPSSEDGALSLAAEVLETLRPLCHRMERECLTQTSGLFSAAVNPTPNPSLRPTLIADSAGAAAAIDELDAVDEMLALGFQALLRTATLLGKKAGLEQLFQRLVMKRAVDELLTPGQLDASGGRGLCKGLPKVLRSLHAYVVRAALPGVAVAEAARA
eukprot:CAMPEP_0118878392 /NCGR_PEP_ID=MMETSP1163-20130328/18305_1 /TAXON_ID=124430 /ORGANISM="Phaeomonas parva, Strain CCMP2877" /LENGTH=450 /DNA_ID=CAMNT_0006814205 /DNA_START=175 /DNA_END=1523 /DNA_ORIENTATION=+